MPKTLAFTGPTVWPPTHAWNSSVRQGVATLEEFVRTWRNTSDDAPILIAVSGGVDSCALAVLAAETQRKTGIRFGAVTLDHGLQEVTASVADGVEKMCTTLGLSPVVRQSLDVVLDGEGIEAAARHARYSAFAKISQSVQAAGVLTAHTANDQAEQVLMGLARGSGLRSIAGIRKQRWHQIPETNPVRIGRPLLEMTRQQMYEICEWSDIQYFDDPMNQDDSLTRIRVRNHLLPALEDPKTGLGKGVFQGLVSSAALASDDNDVLEELGLTSYEQLATVTSSHIEFKLADLQQLHPGILRRVLSLAVQNLGAPQPSFERTQSLLRLVFPPVGRASSAGPIQLEGHVNVYRQKTGQDYAKLIVIPT